MLCVYTTYFDQIYPFFPPPTKLPLLYLPTNCMPSTPPFKTSLIFIPFLVCESNVSPPSPVFLLEKD